MQIAGKPIQNHHVVFREEFDDWAVLFDPYTGAAVGTNPTGAYVWKLLDGTRTLADILEAVEQVFDEVPENAAEDMKEFVDSLAERGFIGYEADL